MKSKPLLIDQLLSEDAALVHTDNNVIVVVVVDEFFHHFPAICDYLIIFRLSPLRLFAHSHGRLVWHHHYVMQRRSQRARRLVGALEHVTDVSKMAVAWHECEEWRSTVGKTQQTTTGIIWRYVFIRKKMAALSSDAYGWINFRFCDDHKNSLSSLDKFIDTSVCGNKINNSIK